MRKMIASALFVVLAVLASAVPASAQAVCWGCIPGDIAEDTYYIVRGDNVGLVMAGNRRMVRDLAGQLPRSLRGDLRWGGNSYGLPIGGGFYPMYDRNMRPMGRREATVTYGAIGAGAGYAILGNARGTVAGGVVGGIVGLLTHRSNNQQRNNGVIVTPPSTQDQQEDDVRVGPDGIPVMVGRPNGNQQEPVSNPPSTAGEWKVSNRTSKRAELWDGEQFIARIEPWQSTQVEAPQSSYKAVLLIPNRSGGLDQAAAQMRSSDNFNGWDIVAPAVQ